MIFQKDIPDVFSGTAEVDETFLAGLRRKIVRAQKPV